ncbi:hypothetical protein KEM60_00222 [Austwickia sp. TVS 96-490-7B]|uniref:serine hydrolase n=1 Tax=Austwickia sp. TVS 96-490-7B TaxID=2830843 RepID=UPI001C572E28|nr:serine hydrolase [Austwickia sp. TVS 96-490-7B]MBW3084039.1 hypothetical protein [Austwickia sp. TVS 96-490-7B]
MTGNGRLWCTAAVTWGVAAVMGMGVAVFAPQLLPQVGPSVAVAQPAPSGSPSVRRVGVLGAPVGARSVAADEEPGARQRAADQAAEYARSRGWRTGIAVIDVTTGDRTYAGDAWGLYRTESGVKLLIAARLLAEGHLDGRTEPMARRMITLSDDDAANSLYAAAGGDGVQTWAAARYRISRFGTPPVSGPGVWGSTQVTPAGMAAFLAAVKNDQRVGPWLTDAMSEMTVVAADGTNQIFGLRAADPGAVVKQGWGGDDVASGHVEGTPSVGYVDRGRYAVAIYTTRLPETPLAQAQSVISAQAKLLMPHGRMPTR